MNLYHLRVFLAVAEHEHITRASEQLILSQPAVTKIIQHLEQEIGLKLIERHGRRIAMTHAGRVLQDYAQRIFGLEREMEDALAALQDLEAGEVTLAANATTGIYLLPSIVARFRTHHPRVALHVSILNSHEIVEQTLNWSLDFGLVEADPLTIAPGLHVEPFAHDELVLIVAPGHPWSKETSLRPEALRNSKLLLREEGSGIREVIEHALIAQRVKLAPLLTLQDNEAIKQMVIKGVGAAIVSSFTVQRELAAGDLVQVPIVGIELHPQLSLIRRPDKQFSRAAQAFYALLRSTTQEEQDFASAYRE